MRKILIIGSDSFLGTHLAQQFNLLGEAVDGGSRRPLEKRLAAPYKQTHFLDITDMQRCKIDFSQYDVIVHAAYNSDETTFASQADGTKKILQSSRNSLHVLISSLAATTEIKSTYGQLKSSLEEFFIANKQMVVRFGLIIGDGGLFGLMIKQLRRYPLLPAIDGGQQNIYYIGIRDAAKKAAEVAQPSNRGRIYNYWYAEPITQIELLKHTSMVMGLSRKFIPVPTAIILAGVLFAEKIGLHLPINSNNIRGLQNNATCPLPSDLGSNPGKSFSQYLRENLI